MKKSKFINFFSKREVQIFFIFFILLAIFTKTEVAGWFDGSRMATIESLVERGTFKIDESNFIEGTQDKIYLDCKYHSERVCGHYYSEKPPILSFFSAGLYFILHNIFGIRIYNSYGYYILTISVIGISASLLLAFFYKSLGFTKIKEKYKLLLTIGLGIGTLILPYSVVFVNNIVSSSLLFISFYFLLKVKFSKRINLKTNMFLIGLLISLAAVVEYTVGIFLLLFFIYILTTKKLRPFILYFILGVIGPLILHFILNYLIYGSFGPAYWLKEAFNYPKSPWPSININKNSVPRWIHPIRISVGDFGIFSISPILLIPFLYLLTALFDKEEPLRKETWIIFLGILGIFYFYAVKYLGQYGGFFGFRFSIIFIPLILFFGSIFFKKKRSKIQSFIFYINFCLSIIISVSALFLPNAGITNILRAYSTINYIHYVSFYICLLIIIILIINIVRFIKKFKNKNKKK